MEERSPDDFLSGIHAVLFAIFDKSEELDYGAMAGQVDYCIDAGCNGITVLGLATEVLKLSFEERVRLIEEVGRSVSGRVTFSVTVAGNSVREQIDLATRACDAEADWLILQPPMAGTYGSDVYLDFFARVADAVELPVALQNAPQYLGRSLSGDDIAHLRERSPNVVAVKSEEPALGIGQIVKSVGPDIAVLGGRGGLEMTDSLRRGCKGFVLAPDLAPVSVRIFSLWEEGRFDEAEALYAKACPAIVFAMQSLEHLITYGKRVFAAHAGVEVHDRTPCMAPTDAGIETAARWANYLRSVEAC